jgi:uncharacterized membrane protein
MPEPATRPTDLERAEAREYVVQRLALVSAVIWALVVMGFMWFVFPTRPFRPTVGMMLGSFALALAVVPWIAYPFLVERVARRRAAARTGESLPPASTP